MAPNLRLDQKAEEALRAASVRTGRSEQDLIREAVDVALGLTTAPGRDEDSEREQRLAQLGIRPARHAYREPDRLITLAQGGTSADLLERDGRL